MCKCDIDYIVSFLGGVVVGAFGTFFMLLAIALRDSEHEPEYNDIDIVLKMREEKQKSQFADSVFLNMSEEALLRVIMETGTELNVDSIAKEYLKNKSYYDMFDKIDSVQIEEY